MNTLHYRVTSEISEVILTQSALSSWQTDVGGLHTDRKEEENPNARLQQLQAGSDKNETDIQITKGRQQIARVRLNR